MFDMLYFKSHKILIDKKAKMLILTKNIKNVIIYKLWKNFIQNYLQLQLGFYILASLSDETAH